MGLLSQNQNTYYGSGNSDNYGDYQFTSLDNIINGFMVAYVGESKLINKVNRTDVQFHAMRGIQEFSYDILKSVKAQEIEVPNTLQMILPQDYVNYSKITTSGNDGIERVLYPTGKTSNPFAITQLTDGAYDFNQANLRKITITCPDASTFNDGDFLKLSFLKENSQLDYLYLILDTDVNMVDGILPPGSDSSPRFFATMSDGFNSTQVAERIAETLNQVNRFNISTLNNIITIEYRETLSSYTSYSSEQFTDITNFQASANFTFTVVNTGATSISNDLQYQAESDTWTNYKSHTPNEIRDDYETDGNYIDHYGRRYGLDPQHSQDNGTFYIDTNKGLIHFGSALAGSTVVLHYISDGLGTDTEMVVHKFAEEAIYKWIAYGVLASRSNIPEYIVQRFKKERFAEARKAKIRLSSIKIEEFTQVLKGLGKPIK